MSSRYVNTWCLGASGLLREESVEGLCPIHTVNLMHLFPLAVPEVYMFIMHQYTSK